MSNNYGKVAISKIVVGDKIMKKVFVGCVTLAMAFVATTNVFAQNIDPVANVKIEAKDPNPFSDYSVAMQSTAEKPLLSDWQVKHAKEIAEATTDAVLDGFLATSEAADSLLAKVKEAYATDPITMIQIASTTQRALVLSKEKQTLWINSLKRAQKNAPDEYRKAFYRDQLILCGVKCCKKSCCK